MEISVEGISSMAGALGEPNHTLVPCWMPKPLPPRNQCTGWFTLADGGGGGRVFMGRRLARWHMVGPKVGKNIRRCGWTTRCGCWWFLGLSDCTNDRCGQCSRLKPSYKSHFERFFNWRVNSNPGHQYNNIEMKDIIHIKLVYEFYTM